VKSYLAVRQIEYDSVDISTDPAGFARLRELGALTTPVLAIGKRWVSGAAFDRLDEFFRTAGGSAVPGDAGPVIGQAVGNVFGQGERVILDAWQLSARLDSLMATAVRYTRKLRDDMLAQPLPVRGKDGRTVRGLAFHIGQAAQAPLWALARIPIVKPMEEYDPPSHLQSAENLATHLEGMGERLRAALATDDEWPAGIVETFHGPYTWHGLLERTCWHVATHLRQLAWLLVDYGVDAEAGLSAADMENLPMPTVVWS
jgi:hypothetical protein